MKMISTIYITVQDTLHKDKCTYFFINVLSTEALFFGSPHLATIQDIIMMKCKKTRGSGEPVSLT